MDTTASGMETCSHFQSKQEGRALPKGGESPPEPPRVFWPARRWPPGEASPWEGAAEVCLMLLDLVFCGASFLRAERPQKVRGEIRTKSIWGG